MVRGTRGALTGLLALALLAPIGAAAHAYLVRSVPTRRAAVLRAPPRVQLWFNERLEPAFARLAVWDARGAQVDTKDARVSIEDPRELSVGLRPLAAGRYVVRFRVLSVDGHVVESEFTFTVRGGS
jgi:methionine-rich copper-binding protein CopC